MESFLSHIKFDLVFSIGEDCGCAMLLRDARIRDMSSPFDWLTNATYKMRMDLLANRFAGFLVREHLNPMVKPTVGYFDADNDYYADAATGFYFYHDFPAGMSLTESYPLVKDKYDRRISRLMERLECGGNVLLVWWSRSKRISDEELTSSLAKVQDAYPTAKFHLLVFENDLSMKPGKTVRHAITDRIARVVGGICPDLQETPGFRPATLKILKQVQTSYPRQRNSERPIRRAIIHFCSLWHFSKADRRAARQWLTERFK